MPEFCRWSWGEECHWIPLPFPKWPHWINLPFLPFTINLALLIALLGMRDGAWLVRASGAQALTLIIWRWEYQNDYERELQTRPETWQWSRGYSIKDRDWIAKQEQRKQGRRKLPGLIWWHFRYERAIWSKELNLYHIQYHIGTRRVERNHPLPKCHRWYAH